MKTTKLFKLLPLTTLLLTGCFDAKIKKEEFLEKLEGVNQALVLENDKLNDVHAVSRLSIETYNYKKGEYYAYKYFALILIVPVSYGTYTWKDGDTYKYFDDKTIDSQDKKGEIDEATFNARMEGHANSVLKLLRNPYSIAKVLAEENAENGLIFGMPEYYSVTSYSNKFTKKNSKGTFKITSTVTYTFDEATYGTNDSDTLSETFTIEFNKDNLPVKYETEKKNRKGDKTKDNWTYSYGDSTFNDPTASNTSESA